jgi:RNA ligase
MTELLQLSSDFDSSQHGDLDQPEDRMQQLEQHLGICMTRHPDLPSLCSFRYSQRESPMHHAIVQESRGVILDESNNWAVVALPFTKFFNLGEANAAEILWQECDMYEKVDGTLMYLYHYDNKWHVATIGSPSAGGPVIHSLPERIRRSLLSKVFENKDHRDQESESESVRLTESVTESSQTIPQLNARHGSTATVSFADLFWQTFHSNKYQLPTQTNLTYLFELCGPANRVVCVYPEPRLVLLGARDRTNGDDYSPTEASSLLLNDYPYMSIDVVQHRADIKTLDDIKQLFASSSPFQLEGFVARNPDGSRVKIKHPGFVALHHVGNGFNARNFIEIIRTGEANEFISYFPAHQEEFTALQRQYNELQDRLQSDWKRCAAVLDVSATGTRKRKAQARFQRDVNQSRIPELMTQLRAGSVRSIGDYLHQMPIADLMRVLGVVDAKAKSSVKRMKRRRRKRRKDNIGKQSDEKCIANRIVHDSNNNHDTDTLASTVRLSDEIESHVLSADDIVAVLRHGSPDSCDNDVAYFVKQIPPAKVCTAFCQQGSTLHNEDRNIILCENGIVKWCLKGYPDETNNAILATWRLHKSNIISRNSKLSAFCPISTVVKRNVVYKVCRTTLSVLGLCIHQPEQKQQPEFRARVKRTLRSHDHAQRIRSLAGIDFSVLRLSANSWKSIAFQLAQCTELVKGNEIYTKLDVVKLYPGIAPLIQRKVLPESSSAFDAVMASLSQLRDTFISLVGSTSRVHCQVHRTSKHSWNTIVLSDKRASDPHSELNEFERSIVSPGVQIDLRQMK